MNVMEFVGYDRRLLLFVMVVCIMPQQLDLIPRWVDAWHNKEITTSFRPKQQTWYLLIDGRETFYNDQNEMREWPTEQQAIDWFQWSGMHEN